MKSGQHAPLVASDAPILQAARQLDDDQASVTSGVALSLQPRAMDDTRSAVLGAVAQGAHRGVAPPAAPGDLAAGSASGQVPSVAIDEAPVVQRARAFAEPLLHGQLLDTGEEALVHAQGVAAILQAIGAAPSMCAAAYLVYAGDYLQKPEETVAHHFGPAEAALVVHTRKLVQLQRTAREAPVAAERQAQQTERVRKMLLAFSRDLRVVLLRLASRLQTLRWYAASKRPCPQLLAEESQQVFAPLANRLGIWQIKWEMEDLAFRFLQPADYQQVARALAERRIERESGVLAAQQQLARHLADAGVTAQVQGRPKHLYSIWKKMHGKALPLARVFDVRALRVIVAGQVPTCYSVPWPAACTLQFGPVPDEYDDYIARPKANGYQSLHTVVFWDDAAGDGRPVEIQIRTQAMHEHAEHGVAAHWAYKEAGTKGYAGVSASSEYDAKIAVLRQLLAWERDLSGPSKSGLFDDRIYVLTPEAAIVELQQGATPVDFAYSVHTNLGHRCRGARVDGAMVPLNTPLQNGQTIEIIAAKEGGPSRDWLNAELGYLVGHRAKSKVRAWFNQLAMEETVARGREAVERLLQREGRTAVRFEELASMVGCLRRRTLFEQVGKDELSLRALEVHLRPGEQPVVDGRAAVAEEATPGARWEQWWCAGGGCGLAHDPAGQVLQAGAAGRHSRFRHPRQGRQHPPQRLRRFRSPAANQPRSGDRGAMGWRCVRGDRMAGRRCTRWMWLLRPTTARVCCAISRMCLPEKRMNVIGVQTQSVKGIAWMTFTIEVTDARQVSRAMSVVGDVAGVRMVRRK